MRSCVAISSAIRSLYPSNQQVSALAIRAQGSSSTRLHLKLSNHPTNEPINLHLTTPPPRHPQHLPRNSQIHLHLPPQNPPTHTQTIMNHLPQAWGRVRPPNTPNHSYHPANYPQAPRRRLRRLRRQLPLPSRPIAAHPTAHRDRNLSHRAEIQRRRRHRRRQPWYAPPNPPQTTKSSN